MRRTFLVQDYYVKCTGWAQYEVVYEDTGLDNLIILDRNDMLGMVKDTLLLVAAQQLY